MSLEKKLAKSVLRRKNSVSGKIRKNCIQDKVIRVSIFRSLNNFYAQAIDDIKGITVASCSSVKKDNKLSGKKSDVARLIGEKIASLLKENNIERVIFDRGSYAYHGRVRSFVEGMRHGGINV